MNNYHVDLSKRILQKAKFGEDSSLLRIELFYIKISSLEYRIENDDLMKVFWVNIYNAYLLIMICEKVALNRIFKLKRIRFCQFALSLNDIENEILGARKNNFLFYQFSNLFYPAYIKKVAVKKFDRKNIAKLDKSILSIL
jgi:hypothetical protein